MEKRTFTFVWPMSDSSDDGDIESETTFDITKRCLNPRQPPDNTINNMGASTSQQQDIRSRLDHKTSTCPSCESNDDLRPSNRSHFLPPAPGAEPREARPRSAQTSQKQVQRQWATLPPISQRAQRNPSIQPAFDSADLESANFFPPQGASPVTKNTTAEKLHRADMEQKRIADNWDAQNLELLNNAQRDREGRGDPVNLEVARQLGFYLVMPGPEGAQVEQDNQACGLANIATLDSRNSPQGTPDPRVLPQASQSSSTAQFRPMPQRGPFNSPYQQAAQQNGPGHAFATGVLDSYNQTDQEIENLFVSLGCPDLDLTSLPVPEFDSFASTGTTTSPFDRGYLDFPSAQRIQQPPNQSNFQHPTVPALLSVERGFPVISESQAQVRSHRRQSNCQEPYPAFAPRGQRKEAPTSLKFQYAMNNGHSGQRSGGRRHPGQPVLQNPTILASSLDTPGGVMNFQNSQFGGESGVQSSPHNPGTPSSLPYQRTRDPSFRNSQISETTQKLHPTEIAAHQFALQHYAQGPNISQLTAGEIGQQQQHRMKAGSTRMSNIQSSGPSSSSPPQGDITNLDPQVYFDPGMRSGQSHQATNYGPGQDAGMEAPPGYTIPRSQTPVELNNGGFPGVGLSAGMMSMTSPSNLIDPNLTPQAYTSQDSPYGMPPSNMAKAVNSLLSASSSRFPISQPYPECSKAPPNKASSLDSMNAPSYFHPSTAQQYPMGMMHPPNMTNKAGSMMYSTPIARMASPQPLNPFNYSMSTPASRPPDGYQPQAAQLRPLAPGSSEPQAATSPGPYTLIKSPRNGYPHPAAFLADTLPILFPNSTPASAPAPDIIPQVAPTQAASPEAVPDEPAPVPQPMKIANHAPVTYGPLPPGTKVSKVPIPGQQQVSRLSDFRQPAPTVDHSVYTRNMTTDPQVDIAEKFAKKHKHLTDEPGRRKSNDNGPNDQSLWIADTARDVIKNMSVAAIGQAVSYPGAPHGEVAKRPRGASSASHLCCDVKYLALSRIKKSKAEDLSLGIIDTLPKGDQSLNCVFCGPATADIGISDERVWLPMEASSGFCEDCRGSTSNFAEEMSTASDFIDLLGGDDMFLYGDDFGIEDGFTPDQSLKQAEKEMMMAEEAKKYQRSVPGPHNTKSRIDGMDISRFQGPQFCYGNGQRQIDINKIYICVPCRKVKFQIVKHGRHEAFADIQETTVDDGKGGARRELKQRQCMVCTQRAEEMCKGCPLRLCVNCRVYLKYNCKGWLDNLFYHYGKEHIRNDAFLLRGDGGGF